MWRIWTVGLWLFPVFSFYAFLPFFVFVFVFKKPSSFLMCDLTYYLRQVMYDAYERAFRLCIV